MFILMSPIQDPGRCLLEVALTYCTETWARRVVWIPARPSISGKELKWVRQRNTRHDGRTGGDEGGIIPKSLPKHPQKASLGKDALATSVKISYQHEMACVVPLPFILPFTKSGYRLLCMRERERCIRITTIYIMFTTFTSNPP